MNQANQVIPWFRLFELFECQDATVAGGLNDDFLNVHGFADLLRLVLRSSYAGAPAVIQVVCPRGTADALSGTCGTEP